jgi:hypothetical protein
MIDTHCCTFGVWPPARHGQQPLRDRAEEIYQIACDVRTLRPLHARCRLSRLLAPTTLKFPIGLFSVLIPLVCMTDRTLLAVRGIAECQQSAYNLVYEPGNQ